MDPSRIRNFSMNALRVSRISILGIAFLCVNVSGQTTSRPRSPLKCDFPKVEILSRQLFVTNGVDVESPVSLTEYQICDEQSKEVESGELLNGEPDIKWISRYDGRGNEIEHEHYTHDTLDYKSVSRFDRLGRMIQVVYDDGSKATCDHKGLQSFCKLVDKDRKLKQRWRTTHDSAAREILRLEFEPGAGLTHRYVYGYDVSGYRNLEVDHYQIDGRKQISRTISVWNKKGKPVKKLWYDESGLRTTTAYEYNSKGDLIKRIEYEGANSVRDERTVEYYLYDVNGQWSKAIETTVRNPGRQPRDEMRRIL